MHQDHFITTQTLNFILDASSPLDFSYFYHLIKSKWSNRFLYLYEFVLWTLLLNSLSIEPLNLIKHNLSNPYDYWPGLCGIKMVELAKVREFTLVKASDILFKF